MTILYVMLFIIVFGVILFAIFGRKADPKRFAKPVTASKAKQFVTHDELKQITKKRLPVLPPIIANCKKIWRNRFGK